MAGCGIQGLCGVVSVCQRLWHDETVRKPGTAKYPEYDEDAVAPVHQFLPALLVLFRAGRRHRSSLGNYVPRRLSCDAEYCQVRSPGFLRTDGISFVLETMVVQQDDFAIIPGIPFLVFDYTQ